MESPLKHNTKSLADQILELYKQLPECGLKSYMAHWFDLRTDVSAEKVAGELYEQNRPKFRDWGTLKDMCIATAIQYATIKTRAEVSSLTQQVEEQKLWRTEAEKKLVEAGQAIGTLSEQVEELTRENKNLRTALDALDKVRVNKSTEIGTLKSELEELKKERERQIDLAALKRVCYHFAGEVSVGHEFNAGDKFEYVWQRWLNDGRIAPWGYHISTSKEVVKVENLVSAFNSPVKQGE